MMDRFSEQVRFILVAGIAAVPLSCLISQLKRLGSQRDSTLDVPPTDNDKMEKVNTEASSSSLDLGSKRDPTDEMEEANASVSSQPEPDSWWEYEAFLSFRGFDTRKKFVSYLYDKLKDKGIYVFKDDRELSPGQDISDILKIIEQSRIAIVVLSRSFAFSTYCLDEVVKIIECKGKKGQIVLPIFYEFDPSNIEENKGSIAEAFKKHEGEYDTTKIQQWRDALSAVAGISGWVSLERFDGDEASLINHVYKFVGEKLTSAPSGSIHRRDLVHMEYHMREIDKRSDFGCNDKRSIGIWGPGGIGKTTIAEEIVKRYARRFDSYCFLINVKADYEEKGDTYLQKKLLDQALNGFKQDVRCRPDGCELIHQRLHLRKVLVVLDDVDAFQQLDALAGSLDWFGNGSRVIITTRNKQLLDGGGMYHTYEVPFLNSDQARKLFKIHSFKLDQSQEGYDELINEFVTYAKGLPLALELVGRSLKGRSTCLWQGELDKLRSFGHPGINQVLRISYDRLENDTFVKNIFLDIAFFFVDKKKNKVEDILSGYGCSPISAISTLQDKALLTIDSMNCLGMHDLIRDMACEIVEEKSGGQLEQRSRLSGTREVVSMLRSRKDKSRIEGISLPDMSKIKEPVPLKANVFAELCHLRILDFLMPRSYRGEQVFQPQDDRLDELSHDLMRFWWDYFPFKYWPSTFIAENLVELRLRWSKLESLWSKEIELGKLKVIDLSNSKCLKIFPNLSKALNVEKIEVYGCESLIEFCCDFQHLTKVERLSFKGCKGLDDLPLLPPNLTKLVLPKSAMTKLSSHIESLIKLNRLTIGCYKELTYFSTEADEVASSVSITELPQPIEHLEELEWLEVSWCTKLVRLSSNLHKLKSLRYLTLIAISIIVLPQSVEHLEKLESLEVCWCTKLERFSSNLHKLTNLRALRIKHCKRLCSLPQLPESLLELGVIFCEGLKTLEGDGWERLQKLLEVSFVDCKGLDQSACRNNLEHIKARMGHTRMRCIYPGKVIPRWFQYRSEGSSITIEVPSARPFSRVALCVVFAVDQYSPDSDNYLKRHDLIFIAAKTNKRDYHVWGFNDIEIQSEGVDDNIQVWSGSVRQKVLKAEAWEDNFRTESAGIIKIRLHFYAKKAFGDKEVKEVKVKRCGVHIFTSEF